MALLAKSDHELNTLLRCELSVGLGIGFIGLLEAAKDANRLLHRVIIVVASTWEQSGVWVQIPPPRPSNGKRVIRFAQITI